METDEPTERWWPLAVTTEEVPRPEGRGTSSVVPFVVAFNRVDVVTATTILVLQVGVIGHHVPCHYDFMLRRRSSHARLRARAVWRLCLLGGGSGDNLLLISSIFAHY